MTKTLNDIFKLEKNYEINSSLSKTDLEKHLKSLKNFEFYENGFNINGSFVPDLGWDDFANPKLISIRFELENSNLKNIRIRPSIVLNIFLTGLVLGIIIIPIKAITQTELNDKIGFGITACGFIFIFLIIRFFTNRKIKLTKKKLKIESIKVNEK